MEQEKIGEQEKERKLDKVRAQEHVRAYKRGKVQKVLTVIQLFVPMLFVMHNGVFCYNEHTNPTKQLMLKKERKI